MSIMFNEISIYIYLRVCARTYLYTGLWFIYIGICSKLLILTQNHTKDFTFLEGWGTYM